MEFQSFCKKLGLVTLTTLTKNTKEAGFYFRERVNLDM